MRINWPKFIVSLLMIALGMYLMATGFVDYEAVPSGEGAIQETGNTAIGPGGMGLLLLGGGVLLLVMTFRRV